MQLTCARGTTLSGGGDDTAAVRRYDM